MNYHQSYYASSLINPRAACLNAFISNESPSIQPHISGMSQGSSMITCSPHHVHERLCCMMFENIVPDGRLCFLVIISPKNTPHGWPVPDTPGTVVQARPRPSQPVGWHRHAQCCDRHANFAGVPPSGGSCIDYTISRASVS